MTHCSSMCKVSISKASYLLSAMCSVQLLTFLNLLFVLYEHPLTFNANEDSEEDQSCKGGLKEK